jgi:hypothetical protein
MYLPQQYINVVNLGFDEEKKLRQLIHKSVPNTDSLYREGRGLCIQVTVCLFSLEVSL